MKVNDGGYITEISAEEAVRMLTPFFLNASLARKNGKTIMQFNIITAWLKICETIGQTKGEG